MKPLIVANWKMNPVSLTEAKRNFEIIKKGVVNFKKVETVICAPFVFLSSLKAKKTLKLGAQDCSWEEKGAFTGEISPVMLKNLGCEYVIIGHSERRKYQKETDETINKKIKPALQAGLKIILCIDNVHQVKKDLKGVLDKKIKDLLIAFEPISAIGTGRPYSPEKAKKINLLIKKNTKKRLPVLYGGSVNSKNALDYIKKANFQGLLVGGASLKPKEFLAIIKQLI